MKMLVVALIGGVVLGLLESYVLAEKIQGTISASPETQRLVVSGVVAFLGVLLGWVMKGMIGGRAKD